MNGPFETLALHLLRTTLVTGLAVLVVMWLLSALRIRSPRLHRVAWLLVLVQGWLLVPFTWQVVVDPPDPIASGSVFVDAATVDVLPSTVLEAGDYVGGPVAIAAAESINPPRRLAPEPFDLISFVTGWGLVAWIIGVTTLIAMGAWRYLKLFAAGKPGELATDAQWLDEWRQARESSALRTPVELRTTRGLGPLVCWVPWVFLVLVPRTLWASLTRADRLAILRHELAHCERGDLWKNLVVRVLALPQWFNPLVWLAVRRFEEAGEWACDDRVAASAGSMDYAKTLLQIADQIAPLPSGAVGMASGVLTRRVERLLHYPNKEVREMRGFILPVLLVAIGLLQVVRIERVAAEETSSPAEVNEVQKEKGPSTRTEKMPAYVIEPPDVITVDIAEVVHKSPRTIQPYDQLIYQYTDQDVKAAPGSRIVNGEQFTTTISERGELSAGSSSQFKATGMRIEDAETILRAFYKVENPGTTMDIDLDFAPGAPQIAGKHLLGPDGKVNFGYRYGAVNVNGLTIEQAKQRIEEHLSYYLVDPKVTVDVHSYNSKKYYVIIRGVAGDTVISGPCLGNDTVTSAIPPIQGLTGIPKVLVERPTKDGNSITVMPVNYEAIAKREDATTDHALLPGDRVIVDVRDACRRSGEAVAFPPGVRVTSYAGTGGGELLAVWEDEYRTPMPSTSNLTSRVAEPLTKLPIRLRYSLDYVIDPKKSLGAMEIEKKGPLITGESSLILGMLRVLEKNELISTVDGQAVVTDVETSSAFTIRPENLARLERMLLQKTEGASPASLQVSLRPQFANDTVAFDVRCRLSRGTEMVSVDTALSLNEGQSCLVQIPAGRGAPDAGDAYLLITRLAEE